MPRDHLFLLSIIYCHFRLGLVWFLTAGIESICLHDFHDKKYDCKFISQRLLIVFGFFQFICYHKKIINSFKTSWIVFMNEKYYFPNISFTWNNFSKIKVCVSVYFYSVAATSHSFSRWQLHRIGLILQKKGCKTLIYILSSFHTISF